jgi:hypothetical protein
MASLIIDPKENMGILESIIRFIKQYDEGHQEHKTRLTMVLFVIAGLLMIGFWPGYLFVLQNAIGR